jgi:asparagine synthase (glutamine-hydrolysing)
MSAAIAHRGPDDSGVICHHVPGLSRRACQTGPPNVGLAHRRLAVIDPSPAGHQPMSNARGDLWLTYNGEIYNFPQLRQRLLTLGYVFRSGTDTEVLLYLYEEYGEQCLALLNGVFAFALLDLRSHSLFLARDRYGARPLYYALGADVFAFGSEVKALLQLPELRRGLSMVGLKDYFTFQNTFGSETLFEGIRMLEPGCWLRLGEAGRLRQGRYWSFQFTEEGTVDAGQAAGRVRELLEAAVARQLVADVPLGAYLSGGLDSGSLVALATRRIPRLMTFTVGYDMKGVDGFEAQFDERHDAEVMSSAMATEHYQTVLHPGDLEFAIRQVIWHLEDLRVGMSYPSYYAARLSSRFVKVVLLGSGGDEVFAGYPWRYRVGHEASSAESWKRDYFAFWNRLLPEDRQHELFTPEVWRELKPISGFERFQMIADRHEGSPSPLKRSLDFEARTFLHGLLVVEDKLTMAHSLEGRFPLLDNDLVDYASALPGQLLWRLETRADENLAGKRVLRDAMRGLLPQSILDKRKQGFSPPSQSWYRDHLGAHIRDLLLGPQARSRGIFRPQFVDQVLQEHNRKVSNHRLLIWSLMSFEWWCRLFLDAPVPAPSPTVAGTR